MAIRHQEPYLFALSPISSIEDTETQEGRQLECHHTSPHVRGVKGFGSIGVWLSIQQRYGNK